MSHTFGSSAAQNQSDLGRLALLLCLLAILATDRLQTYKQQ